MLSGKKLNFVITPVSQPYVSSFEACIARDHLLSTLFSHRPIFCDALCGSGADACSVLYNLFPEKVLLCEYAQTHDGRVLEEEYKTMEANVNNMKLLFSELHGDDAPEIISKNMNCIDFILEMKEGTRIDIMYLDPNWAKYGAKYERTPEEMAEHLKIVPRCFVYKTRWGATTLLPALKKISKGYHAMYSIRATPFRDEINKQELEENHAAVGVFHWVVIVHDALENVSWVRSKAYDDLKAGKDVKIPRSDFMRPFKPLYATNPRFAHERDIKPGEEFIVVHAPKITPPTRPHATHKKARD